MIWDEEVEGRVASWRINAHDPSKYIVYVNRRLPDDERRGAQDWQWYGNKSLGSEFTWEEADKIAKTWVKKGILPKKVL